MPTQLIKKYLEEVARWLRNQQDYCDWTVGMEPIPGDKTWAKKSCGLRESCSCKMSDKSK
jgi:hypothetical protein